MAITGGEIVAAGRAAKVLTSKAKGLVLGDADEREIRTCALNAIDAAVAAATDRVPLASERIALREALWQILADENAGIAWLLEPVIFGAQGELAEKFDELLIDRLRVLRETVPEIGESWEVAAGVDLDRFRDTFQREIIRNLRHSATSKRNTALLRLVSRLDHELLADRIADATRHTDVSIRLSTEQILERIGELKGEVQAAKISNLVGSSDPIARNLYVCEFSSHSPALGVAITNSGIILTAGIEPVASVRNLSSGQRFVSTTIATASEDAIPFRLVSIKAATHGQVMAYESPRLAETMYAFTGDAKRIKTSVFAFAPWISIPSLQGLINNVLLTSMGIEAPAGPVFSENDELVGMIVASSGGVTSYVKTVPSVGTLFNSA